MNDNEAFYDAEIAPALLAIGEKLKERGMFMVATVEYEPGNRASTLNMSDDACFAMQLHRFSALAGENVDSFAINVMRHCRRRNIDVGESMFLKRFSEPTP